MNDEQLKAEFSRLAGIVKDANAQARKLLALHGSLAVFVTDFNGQPHGRSRPSLKGRKVLIDTVFLHSDGTYNFHAWRTDCGRPIDSGFYAKDIRFKV